ncbi:hypothetical protein [Chitinophaga sp. Cy-1792]|uniref:hypothetical protein n=1 Tax=Chitinophaga sp. Cy-1792 TaxID=2608339 RepID=UPI001421CE27|nr:hypothetical protein [Chitinophaga sp. Cy-1792]NIG56959.1 hypothetical protein [Chitinophaga sp. Cy-1792]
MKIIFTLFIIPVLLFACSTNSSERDGDLHTFSSKDTTCPKARLQAEQDFRNGKMMYSFYETFTIDIMRNEEEMKEQLKFFDISDTTEIISDVMTFQKQGCYGKRMKELIGERYGKNFIDSLLNVSDSIFLTRHINDTMYSWGCDTPAIYPGDTIKNTFLSILQQQFAGKVKYPAGYKRGNSTYSSGEVEIQFIVNKTGQAIITGYSFKFDVKENHQYETYFKKKITAIIKTKGWTPARIRGKNVISRCDKSIVFK